MSDPEDGVAPYKYRGKFEQSSTILAAPDLDKQELEAYIKRVLGVERKQEKAEAGKQ